MAKQDQMRMASGSRPASSAACRTVATQRAVVSSVKKVCRITPSKTRPASASDCGPKAVSSSGIGSVRPQSMCRIG